MVWLLYTSTPTSRKQAKNWDPVQTETLKFANRGINTRDQWWWSFRSKRAAQSGRNQIREANKNVGMKLILRDVAEIPVSWR
jgi:hypothetical protein